MAVTVRGDRGAFGGVLTPPQASPLRLGALPAAGVGVPRLAIDATGNVTAGVLAIGDLPLDADWTWGSGHTITFAPGPLAVPAPTSRSLGTRLVLEPVPGSTEYAIGREAGALWTSVPTLVAHKWYQGASERLRLETDGALTLINGVVGLRLNTSPSGETGLDSLNSLYLTTQTGQIGLGTGTGVIAPTAGYRENLGLLSRKFLALHAAELWVETLVAQDTLATIGGRILVGPTTQLFSDVNATVAAIDTKHNNLHIGDWVVLEAAGKFEVMQVVAGPFGPATAPDGRPYYVYNVSRNEDGSGGNDWYAGDAVFNTGTTGDGFIDLYSVRGVNPGTSAGPTIVGNVRTAASAVAWREHWAVGNLRGVYGNASAIYGVAFGKPDGGLHVQIDATNGIRFLDATNLAYSSWDMTGAIRIGYPSTPNITISPAGNIEIRNGSTPMITLRADGTGEMAAGLTVGTNVAGSVAYIKSINAVEWNNGRGFLFKYRKDSDSTEALIGRTTPTARCLQWDGNTIRLTSDGVTIDENGITMLQTAGTAAEPGRVVRFGTTGGYLWDSTAGAGNFVMARPSGDVTVQATTGSVFLAAAGGAAYLLLHPTTGFEAKCPTLFPTVDLGGDLGRTDRRWLSLYAGRIGLGTSVPTSAYHIELANDLAAKPVSSTWTVISDGRAKHDVVSVDPAAALALVRRVPVIRFRYTGDYGTPKDVPGIGVVAQDVAALLPLSVGARSTDGLLDWNAHELFMLNVAAVQALAARVDALEHRKDETA